jgi:hypothetical protein
MIILDKQGKRPTVGCRIAIADVGINRQFSVIPKMYLATVTGINKDSLCVQYDNDAYGVNDEFTNTEFVIIPGEVVSLYGSLEQELYKVGVVNV